MIYPYSFSLLSIEAIRAAANQTGKQHSIAATDPINPATLCGAMALRDWKEVIEKGKGELGHFYVSFYVETEDVYSILSLSQLQMLKLDNGVYILTTNILGWRDVITHGLSKDSSEETRKVLNYIFAYLRDNGFSSLFSKYRRKNLAFDGTIVLEED